MIKQGYPSESLLMPSRKFLSVAVLALVALAYVVITIHILHPRYIVNDNFINMNFIIAGYPLDYMGVLFTQLLHQAYVMQPELPWYALGLYALHVLSVFMWLMLLWRSFQVRWLAFIFIGVFFLYYAIFLIELDYTSTSELLCVSALVYTCLDVLERRPGYFRYLGLGMVFTLGMLARPQGVLGSFACITPLALIVAIQCLHRDLLASELRRLVLISVMFMAPAALNLAADSAYRYYTLTPQQAAYDAFNRPRGLLHALSPERQGEVIMDHRLLQKVHWGIGDAQNFFNWRFLDERIYTPTALETLVREAPYAKHTFSDVITRVMQVVQEKRDLLLLFLCSIPLFLLALPRQPLLAGLGLLLPLYCVALDSFVSVFLTFRDRTEVPFLGCYCFMTLVIAGYLGTCENHGSKKVNNALLGICVLLALVASWMSIGSLRVTSKKNAANGYYMLNALQVLNHDYAGNVVLESQNALHPEALNPLTNYHYYFHDIDMVWDTFSPHFYDSLKPLGVQHGYEVIDAMINNKNAYFLGNDFSADKLLDSYADKSRGDVSKLLVRTLNPYLYLYRFVRTGKAPQAEQAHGPQAGNLHPHDHLR